MACSAAQLDANRKNAAKSTGPKTPEGKARSRCNALKHGLTGAGIALSPEDAAEVNRRFEALEGEMAPGGELATIMVHRVATLSVRLERCARHEARCAANRARNAVPEFDDRRLAEVEKTFSWIATEPSTAARRLRATPEGVDRLLEALGRLKGELEHPDGVRWDWTCCEHLHHLTGRRRLEIPVTRVRALSEAIMGDFRYLGSADGEGLAGMDRRGWAADALIAIVKEEIAALKAARAGLDHESLALDRAEAGDRALFDPSPAATLARKYEAAAERGFFRTLREFREVQAEMAETDDITGFPESPGPESGSSFPVGERPPYEDVDESEIVPAAPPRADQTAPMIPPGGSDDGPRDLGSAWR